MVRRRGIAVAAPSGALSVTLIRLLQVVLILMVVVGVGLAGVAGFLTYRVITSKNDTENVTPQNYLQITYENLSFTDPSGGEHEGWLLRGLKGAPVIFLCPGYQSNRADWLPLGMLLRENHFNVYVFNFYGPKTGESSSNLGVREASDLQAAINKVIRAAGVNPHRVGLLGTNIGAYASLVVAEQSSLVKAVVLDSVYENPTQMFQSQIENLLGGSGPTFRSVATAEFRLFNLGLKVPQLQQNFSKLEGVPKLFIEGRDEPLLAAATGRLYALAPNPKQLRIMEHAQSELSSGFEKKEYENQVLNFFLQNLPLRAD